MKQKMAASLALASVVWAGNAVACGAGFCLGDTGWDAQGGNTREGWTLGLRYEYIHNNRPLSGSTKVAPITAAAPQQGEITTTNRNYLVDLGYTFDSHWQVELEVPLMQRYHQHYDAALNLLTWNYQTLGDIKLLTSYRFADAGEPGFGVRAGIKLPTGSISQLATDGVTLAERMFQPGTGSTDLILGAFYSHDSHDSDLHWFASGHLQQPLTTRNGGPGGADQTYRPGNTLALGAGLTYPLMEKLRLTVQGNWHQTGRESGTAGDPVNTGGRTLAVSPGFSFAAAPDTQLYASLQLPVYQYLNGTQLSNTLGVMVGANQRF